MGSACGLGASPTPDPGSRLALYHVCVLLVVVVLLAAAANKTELGQRP
jgi:hypothetical protein